MSEDERIALANELYERAVFGGDDGAVDRADRELDAVEAELSLARGKVMHARFLADRVADAAELALFERAVELFGRLGDGRGEGEALFWLGCFHQVVRRDSAVAVPSFARARALATAAGDALTLSYVVRHLGFVEWEGGRTAAAEELLTESVRLREEIGFLPGVAAGKLVLAELAAEAGDAGRAHELLDAAAALAQQSGAAGVARWIEDQRAATDPAR